MILQRRWSGVLAACTVAMPIAAQDLPSFRSAVSIIVVPASVTRNGASVSGLTAADFELRDNGVLQKVSSSLIETMPLDVTLLLDTSGSLRGPALEQFKSDVGAMVRLLADEDRVQLLTFAMHARLVFGFQSPRVPLPLDRVQASGATAFYDALVAALTAFPRSDRPQLLFVLTDGEDTRSFLDARDVLGLANQSSAALFIAIESPRPLPGPVAGQPDHPLVTLREAALRTGGGMSQRRPDVSLPETFRRALSVFRTSYLLTYTPEGVARSGWHDITVRTKDRGLVVRARRGYHGG
jgi:VWFA-related protein